MKLYLWDNGFDGIELIGKFDIINHDESDVYTLRIYKTGLQIVHHPDVLEWKNTINFLVEFLNNYDITSLSMIADDGKPILSDESIEICRTMKKQRTTRITAFTSSMYNHVKQDDETITFAFKYVN